MQIVHIGAFPTIEQLEHAAPQLVLLLFGTLQAPLLRIWPAGQEVQDWLLVELHVAQLDEHMMQVLLDERIPPGKQVKHMEGLLGEHCMQLLAIVHFEHTPVVEPK